MAAPVLGPAQFAKRLGIAPLFQGLGEEPLLAIAKHAVLRSLRRGQILWKYRAHAYELAFVWDGHLQVRRAEESLTFRAVRQNEIIGVSNAMGLTPCTVDVVAGEATRVLLVPGELLRSLVPKYPEIAFRALDHMGELLGRLSDEVELLHRGTLEDRVVHRLRSLSAGRKEVKITHGELAEHVAARRESVSRVLASLEKRGVLRCRRGRIELTADGRDGA
jgi:CRP-like cAMP-binding protein